MPYDFSQAWYLTGPTASGKTAVSLELAGLLNAEIVSLDSMAIYRGMEIGTAKPLATERAAGPHHLLDIVNPDQDFSLAQYLAAADLACREIAARGRQVLFVGGTPLYLKALLRGIFEGPPANWPVRESLLALAKREGDAVLHARLAAVDPQSATRLHPRDTRRVIRALEVWETTGQTISELQTQFDQPRGVGAPRVFVLQWPRPELVCRIDLRVRQMFAAGFVEEVRGLQERYPALGRTASQAVGYREVAAHLAGEHSLAETMDLVCLRTRQFAKRQMTWFRSLPECRPIAVQCELDLGRVAGQIAAVERG